MVTIDYLSPPSQRPQREEQEKNYLRLLSSRDDLAQPGELSVFGKSPCERKWHERE
jgi:hypothetical protein